MFLLQISIDAIISPRFHRLEWEIYCQNTSRFLSSHSVSYKVHTSLANISIKSKQKFLPANSFLLLSIHEVYSSTMKDSYTFARLYAD